MAESNSIDVSAGEGRAFEAKRGQYITITNLQGRQVADFVAFNARDLAEKVGASNTIVHLGSLVVGVGNEILSNRRRVMLEVVLDDCGGHDLVVAPCDAARYEIYFDVKDHRNCAANFLEALAPWDLELGDQDRPSPSEPRPCC